MSNNRFTVGDKIAFLHEDRKGVVVEVLSGNQLIVEDEDGFNIKTLASNICMVHNASYTLDGIHDYRVGIKDDERKESVKSGKRKPIDIWEVDLHAHELLDSTLGMSNGEILMHQMKVFKGELSKARNANIRCLIVIHGVGKGVLKGELYNYLRQLDNVSFCEADPKEYGVGATEIKIHY